jgi:hypothetical protein
MTFTPVKSGSVRISSLSPNALVQLRVGKAAVKSVDDVTVEAKVVRQYEENYQSLVVFQETDADGQVTEFSVSRFPNASWRWGKRYVSLLGVDESTFTIVRATPPTLQVDVIDEAIRLVEVNAEDVFAWVPTVDLLKEVRDGSRINAKIKEIVGRLAAKYVEELSALEPLDDQIKS